LIVTNHHRVPILVAEILWNPVSTYLAPLNLEEGKPQLAKLLHGYISELPMRYLNLAGCHDKLISSEAPPELRDDHIEYQSLAHQAGNASFN